MLSHTAHASFPSHTACSHTQHTPASRRTPHAHTQSTRQLPVAPVPTSSWPRLPHIACPRPRLLVRPCLPTKEAYAEKENYHFVNLSRAPGPGAHNAEGQRGPRGHRSSRIRSCARMAIPCSTRYQRSRRTRAGVDEHAAGSRRASPEDQEQRRRRASPDVRAWRWGSTSTQRGLARGEVHVVEHAAGSRGRPRARSGVSQSVARGTGAAAESLA